MAGNWLLPRQLLVPLLLLLLPVLVLSLVLLLDCVRPVGDAGTSGVGLKGGGQQGYQEITPWS